MSEHFRAFSFVDKIDAVDPGKSVSGSYQIPPQIDSFPLSLCAEAVGQLAAWSAMAHIHFSHRPVAGIAGKIEFLREVHAGETLQLSAELFEANEESVSYGGSACVDGVEVIRLHDCLGPMMPLNEFDSFDAMEQRYHRIKEEGAVPHAFSGVKEFPFLWDDERSLPGESAVACFQVPSDELFFEDHFPRKPVFPGTLLMDANLRFARQLADQIPGGEKQIDWKAKGMSNIKLRDFMSPGAELELHGKIKKQGDDFLTLVVESRKDGKRNSRTLIDFTA